MWCTFTACSHHIQSKCFILHMKSPENLAENKSILTKLVVGVFSSCIDCKSRGFFSIEHARNSGNSHVFGNIFYLQWSEKCIFYFNFCDFIDNFIEYSRFFAILLNVPDLFEFLNIRDFSYDFCSFSCFSNIASPYTQLKVFLHCTI